MSAIDLQNLRIGFIGGGNMARSLIGGLLQRKASATNITVSDPIDAQLRQLESQFGIFATRDNTQVLRRSDVVILAVKPQDLHPVARSLAAVMGTPPPLFISIAAGARARDIRRWLGGVPVVRAMPNRPALQGCGVSGVYAPAEVTAGDRDFAAAILGAVGPVVWVDEEDQMDAVTAVSGSGPAYVFMLIEMMESAGVNLGLTPEVSRRLAIETAFGSAVMSRDSAESPAVLRQQVTSKGGTTEAALRVLESSGVRDIFAGAIAAAASRSAQLAEELGKV